MADTAVTEAPVTDVPETAAPDEPQAPHPNAQVGKAPRTWRYDGCWLHPAVLTDDQLEAVVGAGPAHEGPESWRKAVAAELERRNRVATIRQSVIVALRPKQFTAFMDLLERLGRTSMYAFDREAAVAAWLDAHGLPTLDELHATYRDA